jgi:hypothetical protein
MNKYVIDIDNFYCDSYYRSKYKPNYHSIKINDPSAFLVISFEDSNEIIPEFIFNSSAGHYFCSSKFKKLILENFENVTFEKVHRIENSNLNELWKINFEENLSGDFTVINDNLIVTDKAMKFLKENKVFQENFIGEVYEKKYDVYTNMFKVSGDIEDFLENNLPNLRKIVLDIRFEIDSEWSRRSKL